MEIIAERMPGVALIETQTFSDARDSFTETFNRAKMADFGTDRERVQAEGLADLDATSECRDAGVEKADRSDACFVKTRVAGSEPSSRA